MTCEIVQAINMKFYSNDDGSDVHFKRFVMPLDDLTKLSLENCNEYEFSCCLKLQTKFCIRNIIRLRLLVIMIIKIKATLHMTVSSHDDDGY